MKRHGFFCRLLSEWLELVAMIAAWIVFTASFAACVTLFFYVSLIGFLGLGRIPARTVSVSIGIAVVAALICAGISFFASLLTKPPPQAGAVKKAVGDEGKDGDGKEHV